MIIQQDTRQKKKHHILKEKWFNEHDITVINSKMLVGDYCIPTGKVSVDTKQNIKELYQDLIQDHDRFKRECVLAKEIGVQLYILTENRDMINSIEEVTRWKNPQQLVWLKRQREGKKCKPPTSNQQLIKIMHTMTLRYGVIFLFCSPEESAPMIVDLLGEEDESDYKFY